MFEEVLLTDGEGKQSVHENFEFLAVFVRRKMVRALECAHEMGSVLRSGSVDPCYDVRHKSCCARYEFLCFSESLREHRIRQNLRDIG
jgi:hypothetical protein